MERKKNGREEHVALGFTEWMDWFWNYEWYVDPKNWEEEKDYITGKRKTI